MPQDFDPSRVPEHRWFEDPGRAPTATEDSDPVGRLVRLLARSAAADFVGSAAVFCVSSAALAVGSYRP
jgi:hypothetical protein